MGPYYSVPLPNPFEIGAEVAVEILKRLDYTERQTRNPCLVPPEIFI